MTAIGIGALVGLFVTLDRINDQIHQKGGRKNDSE